MLLAPGHFLKRNRGLQLPVMTDSEHIYIMFNVIISLLTSPRPPRCKTMASHSDSPLSCFLWLNSFTNKQTCRRSQYVGVLRPVPFLTRNIFL